MAERALATAFVNIVPGTVELERYLKSELGKQVEAAGKTAGTRLTDSLSASFKQAGQKMSDVGKTLSLSVTAPLTAIGLKSIKTAADFEVAMASLQVNSGASGAAMEKMRDLAIQMGQDTVFSAGEAANAMLELSKGGMDPAVISGGALQATMALAATESMSLSDAATIVTQSMNTFGIQAGDTMKAVDLLAAGAVASTAGVFDLADGMKYVGATASQIGVPMGDAVTALAALNNAGIDSTTAGTSLNRMLLGLVPTTKKGKQAMEDLGVSFLNQDGSVKSLGEVIGILQESMDGLTDAERLTALKNMFGVEGMRAASVLLDLNADGWQNLNEQVNKGGVAGDLANARMSGLAGAIEQLKGSIDTAFLAVGDRLAPATKALTAFFTNMINGFASLSPETQSFIVTAGAIAAALGPVLIFLGNVTKAVGVLIPVIQKLWLAMAANPIGALITVIGLVVAALIYFFTQTETGKKAWAAFTKFLGDAWNNFVNFFVNLGKNITQGWQKTITGVRQIWDKIFAFFTGIPQKMAEFGKNIIEGLINGIKNSFANAGKAIGDVASGIVNTFKGFLGINSPSKVFREFGKNIVQGLTQGLTGSERDIDATMKKVSSWITEKFEKGELSQAGTRAARALVKSYTAELKSLEAALQETQKLLADAQNDVTRRIEERLSYIQGLAAKMGSALAIEDPATAEALAKAQKEVNEAQADYNELIATGTASAEKMKTAKEKLLEAEQNLQKVQAQGTTFEDAVKQLQDRIAKTKELNSVTQQLIDLGLNDGLLKQIVEAGAVDFAKSIIAGGSEAVNQLNVLSDEADAEAVALATKVGDVLFNEGIVFAQSVVTELQNKEKDIEATMRRVAKKFADEISDGVKVAAGIAKKAADDAKSAAKTANDAASAARSAAGAASSAASAASAAASAARSASVSSGETNKFNNLRKMATGGFVTGPTPALIGEAGPEVVTPLKDFERWMGLDKPSKEKVINYYAAPNNSLDAEQALLQAMKRAKVVGAW